MTTLLEIKPYIHDFIQANLDEAFNNKVYWLGERVNIPEYPYCLLNAIAENKDKRTSHAIGDLVDEQREQITTRYKTCTITVGIYNAWVRDIYDDMDMDEAKEFAYTQIDILEGSFEDYPLNNLFSVQNISPIRPLPEVVDGGYMYRYEFDLTIGYNENVSKYQDTGKEVDVTIENKDIEDSDINFIVTVNDTVNINI